LENCELVPNRSNDGDSFHIRTNNAEYLVRLYFVDAPETGGVGSPERLIEQARYFGVSVPQVIQIGQNAKSFVEAKLAKPFIVITRMAEGLGHSNVPRILGFVKTKEGADLGEQLVVNGLARIHGTKTALPDGASAQDEIQKLEQLQAKAKQARLGGWSVTGVASTDNGPAPSPIATAGIVSSTATATPGVIKSSAPIVSLNPTPSNQTAIKVPPKLAQAGKLDINTATKEQLQKIPGIGEKTADHIIAARPFETADDLKNVKGIGSGKRYEELRPFFR